MKKMLKILIGFIAILNLSQIKVSAAAANPSIMRLLQTHHMKEPYRQIYAINQLIKQLFFDKRVNEQPFTDQDFENALLELNTQEANRLYQVFKALFDAIENTIKPGVKQSVPQQNLSLTSAIDAAKIYFKVLFQIQKTGPNTQFTPINEVLRNNGIKALSKQQRQDLESLLADIFDTIARKKTQEKYFRANFSHYSFHESPLQLSLEGRLQPTAPPPAAGAQAAAGAGAGATSKTEIKDEKEDANQDSVIKHDAQKNTELKNLLKELISRNGKFADDQAFINGWKEFKALKGLDVLKAEDSDGLELKDYINAINMAKLDDQYPLEARFKPAKGEDKIQFDRERIKLIEGYWRFPNEGDYFPLPIAHEKPWEGQEEFLIKLLRIQRASLRELLKPENLIAGKYTSDPRIFVNELNPRFFLLRNGSDCRLGCWRGIAQGTAAHFIDPNNIITWQGMLFHYVEAHNVIPSREFYRYIMNFPEELLQKMEKAAQNYPLPPSIRQNPGMHDYL